jgi:hypothetical protein
MHLSIGQYEPKPKRSIAVRCCNNCNNLTSTSFSTFSINCRVHYRYDLDNSVMAIKFALDAFKQWGGVKDDSPKYVDRIKMTYDPSLPKDTAEIIFEGYVVDSDS